MTIALSISFLLLAYLFRSQFERKIFKGHENIVFLWIVGEEAIVRDTDRKVVSIIEEKVRHPRLWDWYEGRGGNAAYPPHIPIPIKGIGADFGHTIKHWEQICYCSAVAAALEIYWLIPVLWLALGAWFLYWYHYGFAYPPDGSLKHWFQSIFSFWKNRHAKQKGASS